MKMIHKISYPKTNTIKLHFNKYIFYIVGTNSICFNASSVSSTLLRKLYAFIDKLLNNLRNGCNIQAFCQID